MSSEITRLRVFVLTALLCILSLGFAGAQTSASDPNPGITARAKEWVQRLQTGDIDRSQLEETMNAASPNTLLKFLASSFAGLSGTQDIAPSLSTTTNVSDPVQSAFDSSGKLWVANDGSASVAVYDTGLNSVATLIGPSTDRSGPTGVGFDDAGHLWVANNASDTVTEYDASGNVAPLARIAGVSTGLNGPVGLAFDDAGNLWVASRFATSITVYAAGALPAGGNIAPITTITAALNQASGLTFTP